MRGKGKIGEKKGENGKEMEGKGWETGEKWEKMGRKRGNGAGGFQLGTAVGNGEGSWS